MDGEKTWRQLHKILLAILNNSWRRNFTKQQLYGYLPPIMEKIKLDGPDTQDTAGEVGSSS